MLRDYFFLIIGGLLVNNVVLSRLWGVCPFLKGSDKLRPAAALSLTVTVTMLLSTAAAYPLYRYALEPHGLAGLRTLVFVAVIALLAPAAARLLAALIKPLYARADGEATLTAVNCAVLGVTLLGGGGGDGFAGAMAGALGAGLGFMLAMCLFAGIRERMDDADIPEKWRGLPVTLVAASLVSLSFWGFQGLIP